MRKTDESEYVGKIFGDLKIIRRVESKVREAKWFCICSCGYNTIVATSKLKEGKNCCSKCSKNRRGKPANFIDLTGQKFGHLLVLKQVTGNRYGHTKYECQCDCGNKPVLLAALLKKQTYCVKCKPGAENWERKTTDTHKYCIRCKTFKKLEEFRIRTDRKDGRDSYCVFCAREYQQQWKRKSFYGMTEEQYNEALKTHSQKCAMCGRYDNLIIDHCHLTGKFRGLICRFCNFILGRFKDDPSILHKAQKYLNQHIHEPISCS